MHGTVALNMCLERTLVHLILGQFDGMRVGWFATISGSSSLGLAILGFGGIFGN
jgi:hypothetical protein